MRTRVKLFYRGDWETGYEIKDEYREWISKYEYGDASFDFQLVAERTVGNWIIVWYRAANKPIYFN